MEKTIDRHHEPEMVVLGSRIPADHYATIHAISKDEDRTKGSIIRQALREFLERRNAKAAR